ncbi:MAG: ABC transporter permease [Thermoplasmata archaeon]|nr:ABC transporter permease [Thermoplasmata archaeon]
MTSTLSETGARLAHGAPRAVAIVLSASLLILFVLPIVALVTYVPPGTSAPSVPPPPRAGALAPLWPGPGAPTWLVEIAKAAGDPGAETALSFTLFASGIALAVSFVLGVPLGYLLARHRFPGRSLVEAAVALPVVVPHLVAGLALLLLFQPQSPIGSLAIQLGVPVFGTIWGVALVMIYVSAPYTVLASELSFRAVDAGAVEAARTLGASPAQAFQHVTLPLALRGILAGGILTWARAVSEIGGFLILAYSVYPSGPYQGPVTSTLSVYLYNLYQIEGIVGVASTASAFLLLAFGIFLAVRLLERWGRLPWAPRGLLP